MDARGRTDAAPGSTRRIAVVVPYFQRRAGLLARALRSVFDQEGAGPLEVLVVDDGSPIAAEGELAALAPHERAAVRVLRQANGGPAVARNRALDALDGRDDVELVAFLDSDDVWRPEHLARARRALASADVYVANWMPLEAAVDAYTHFRRLELAEHEPLGDDLWCFRGDFFDQELLRPIGRLSTLVLRRAPFANVRFDARLSCAFEDRLYRLELARRAPRVVFSTRPEVDSGEGVNVFSSARWGTAQRLDVARDELCAAEVVRGRFPLDARQRAAIAGNVRRERVDAWSSWLRLVASGRGLEARRIARLLAVDPAGPFVALVQACRTLRAARITRAARPRRARRYAVTARGP